MKLTTSQRIALEILSRVPHASSASENTDKTINAATGRALEDRGLAESIPDPAYARANGRYTVYFAFRITDAGREAIA